MVIAYFLFFFFCCFPGLKIWTYWHSTNVDHLGKQPKLTPQQQNPKFPEANSIATKIFDKYAKCFEGYRMDFEPNHTKIQPDAIQLFHPPRKLPVALRTEFFERTEWYGVERWS